MARPPQPAQATAQKVFEQGGVGGDLPSITIDPARLESGVAIIDLLVESGLAVSKGEARRLIQAAAHASMMNKSKMSRATQAMRI